MHTKNLVLFLSRSTMFKRMAICILLACSSSVAWAQTGNKGIVHDAAYYILFSQNGERWMEEDKFLDATLAELRKKNGAPPNIVYLQGDDTAFGAVGIPGLQKNSGYETPSINRMAVEGCIEEGSRYETIRRSMTVCRGDRHWN